MLMYLVIFIAKVFEVSLMTLRTVLVTKGEKLLGSLIGIVEIIIWILVASNVLTGLKDDPFKMVVYAAGFSVGIYLGSVIEEKLAIGLITIQVILNRSEGEELTDYLRDKGIGITVMEGQGLSEPKSILILHIQRKRKNEVINDIVEKSPDAVISSSELKMVYGGYGLKK